MPQLLYVAVSELQVVPVQLWRNPIQYLLRSRDHQKPYLHFQYGILDVDLGFPRSSLMSTTP
jgi:hypothetical protein